MKTAFIFDIDGTLLNTEQMYMKSLQLTLANHGINKTYDEVYAVFGLPSFESLQYLGVNNPKAMQAEWQGHYHDFWHEVYLFDGVSAMLQLLRTNQQNALAVVTSNTATEFKDHVTPFGITQYFDSFTFAGDTPRMKPFPDPIIHALADLDVDSSKAIYIGDSVHDMQAAHTAGIDFGLATWGVKDIAKFGDEPDYLFKHPLDITKNI